jgi:hypothetical protein
LWNTFVMVGTAQAFANMIRGSASDLYADFESFLDEPEGSEDTLNALYENLRPGDFSEQVLSANKERLAVLPLGDVGWSDLGDPRRVINLLSASGQQQEWVKHWHRTNPVHQGIHSVSLVEV